MKSCFDYNNYVINDYTLVFVKLVSKDYKIQRVVADKKIVRPFKVAVRGRDGGG